MATNRSCPKDEFNWSSYPKVPRKLTAAMEAALVHGRLRPILDYVLDEPEVRFEIRPRKANLYFDGGNLLRLEGAGHGAFRGVFDLGYVGGKGPAVCDLDSLPAAKRAVEGFAERRSQMRTYRSERAGAVERRIEQHIAAANDARSLVDAGDFVIVDMEYRYARRQFDLVLFDRGGLPRPRLMYCELKCRGAALTGESGLQKHGIDYGELLRAKDGLHIERSKLELADMIEQKKRLGLLAADLDFEAFSAEPPEFLVIFADYDVCRAELRTPLARMRAEITQRFGGLELLKFADFPKVDDGTGLLLRLRREQVMDSREFDAHRVRAH